MVRKSDGSRRPRASARAAASPSAVVLASSLGLLAATWLTARVLRPLRRAQPRRCGGFGEGDLEARARRARRATRSPQVAARVQRHGRAPASATAPARWASCCRRSRPPRRPSTACRIRCWCSTATGKLQGANARRRVAARHRRRARGRRPVRGRRSRGARAGRAAARARAGAARAPTCPRASRRRCASRRRRGRARAACRAPRPSTARTARSRARPIVLQDVTRLLRFDELKNDLVATVAHEFRTPLTSLRMAIHLCTEEAVGPLTPQAGRPAVRGARGLRAAAGHRRRSAQPVAHPVRDASSCTAAAPIRARSSTWPSNRTAPRPSRREVTLRAEVLPGLPEVFVDPDRAAAGVLEPAGQRDPLRAARQRDRRARARRGGARRGRVAPRADADARALRGRATAGPGIPPSTRRACSRSSSACPAARRAARAWACSSPRGSSRRTAARSASRASRARARLLVHRPGRRACRLSAVRARPLGPARPLASGIAPLAVVASRRARPRWHRRHMTTTNPYEHRTCVSRTRRSACRFRGRSCAGCWRAPLRMVDLVLGERRRFAANVAQEHRLPSLLLVLTVATAVFALPFGAVLGLGGFWRVAALLLGGARHLRPVAARVRALPRRGTVVGADAGRIAGGRSGDVAVHAGAGPDPRLLPRDDVGIVGRHASRRWRFSCWSARSRPASASCSACLLGDRALARRIGAAAIAGLHSLDRAVRLHHGAAGRACSGSARSRDHRCGEISRRCCWRLRCTGSRSAAFTVRASACTTSSSFRCCS